MAGIVLVQLLVAPLSAGFNYLAAVPAALLLAKRFLKQKITNAAAISG